MRKSKPSKPPSAADRTVSIFTGKTDLDAPNARDGSDPVPPDDLSDIVRMRRRYSWKRYQLTEFACEALNATIYVENEDAKSKSGRWFYRLWKGGREVGVFDNICAAADAAEKAAA